MRDTILNFIDRINAHDVEGIVALMSPDFHFINSSGDSYTGKFMEQEWKKYFDAYPDFQIHVDRVIADDGGVAVFGWSEGTYATRNHLDEENHWSVPAAWLGTARDGKVTHWQVFADNSWVFEILKENEALP